MRASMGRRHDTTASSRLPQYPELVSPPGILKNHFSFRSPIANITNSSTFLRVNYSKV